MALILRIASMEQIEKSEYAQTYSSRGKRDSDYMHLFTHTSATEDETKEYILTNITLSVKKQAHRTSIYLYLGGKLQRTATNCPEARSKRTRKCQFKTRGVDLQACSILQVLVQEATEVDRPEARLNAQIGNFSQHASWRHCPFKLQASALQSFTPASSDHQSSRCHSDVPERWYE
ncbi:hypothetical protein BDP27DRAFT_1371487 [Rhodocollybia butyracea]|uniref:Uncharacterized protein n=1 Tax=Rhodocollybia butyracea TaxID=206335 RepID=A0A9P5PC72_9AGAR|nr:hypothetical protein BDP27DRAFT_1371487 [Rhodocollybia butyracea]